MKLEIDLADRDEIAAAVPLLQVILDNTPKTCGGHCHEKMDISGTPIADPAAVFGGGAQPAAPLPPAGAPSIAGAVPLPIAPEGTTATISTATPTAPVPPVPTPASAGPAPSVPAAPSTPAPAVDLDKNGLPWDERIHAGSKAKVKDGSWRMKKEVAPELVASVEAELRGRMAASAPAPGLASQPWPFPPAAPEVPAAPAIPTAPPVAPLVPAAPVAPSVVVDPTTFEQLMPRVTAAVTSGVLAPTAVNAACAANGLASVVALQQNPQYVPLVWATLKQQNPALQ